MKTPAARVLMLVENHYPEDRRVRNEATLLTSNGYEVTVIALQKRGQPAIDMVDGVRVYRLPRLEVFTKTSPNAVGRLQRLALKIKSAVGYITEYAYFTTGCFLLASVALVRHGFDVIHAHNPPDTLFLVALPFKTLGKKFVFDHHDLSPELYRSRYGTGDDILARLLRILEWCSLRLADITIATNDSYRSAQLSRANKDASSVFVVRNGPDLDRMRPSAPSPRLRAMGKSILCYIGSLNPQDGVDYLLRSLHYLLRTLKRDDFYCVIMGTGDSLEDLRRLADELALTGHVELPGFVSEADLGTNLAAADICVDPDPSSPLNDVSTWIKIMEYMACAKPIVAFELKETKVSASDAALFVTPNDESAFAEAIVRLMDDPRLRERMGVFGRQRVENELQWSVVGANLLHAYHSVTR